MWVCSEYVCVRKEKENEGGRERKGKGRKGGMEEGGRERGRKREREEIDTRERTHKVLCFSNQEEESGTEGKRGGER